MVGQRQGLRLHHHRWAGAGCAHSESKEPPSRLAHAGFPAAAAGQPGHKPAQKCRRVLLSGTSSHRSAVSDRCSSTIATSTPLASAAWPRESPWSSSWGRSKRPARWRRPLLHTRPEVLACASLTGARRSPRPDRSIQGHRARRRLCTRWPAAEDRPTGSRPLRRVLITSRMPTLTRTLGTASASGVARKPHVTGVPNTATFIRCKQVLSEDSTQLV